MPLCYRRDVACRWPPPVSRPAIQTRPDPPNTREHVSQARQGRTPLVSKLTLGHLTSHGRLPTLEPQRPFAAPSCSSKTSPSFHTLPTTLEDVTQDWGLASQFAFFIFNLPVTAKTLNPRSRWRPRRARRRRQETLVMAPRSITAPMTISLAITMPSPTLYPSKHSLTISSLPSAPYPP